MDATAQTPAPGPQAPTPWPDAAMAQRWYRGPTPQLAVAAVVVAALATVLLTVAEVLWFPIDMEAIERADDAGWDESLLLPHQFALDAALMGA